MGCLKGILVSQDRSRYVRSTKDRSSWCRLSQSGQVMSGQDILSQFGSSQNKTRQVKSGQVKLSYDQASKVGIG